MRWMIVVLGALTLSGQDFFPMHTGDCWIYRGPGDALTAVRIDRQDGAYFVFRYQEHGERWLRRDQSRILELDRSTGEESILYDLAATGSTESDFAAPFGTSKMLSIPFEQYPQRGIVTFLAGVGKFGSRASLIGGSASMAPPRVEELVYARVGGIEWVPAKEYGVSLTIDRPAYKLDFGSTDNCWWVVLPGARPTASDYQPCMRVRFSVRNSSAEPLALVFPSGRLYEMELLNEAGEIVWRGGESRDRPVELSVVNETHFTQVVRLHGLWENGTYPKLPAGRYRVNARLMDRVDGGNAASVVFDIR